MCLKNPECSWCEGRCREYQPTNPVTLSTALLLLYPPKTFCVSISIRITAAVCNPCFVFTVWQYWLPGPGSLPVWLPVLSGVQWHSSFSGPCPWGIWLVCSEWVLPTSVRWDPGREEGGQKRRAKPQTEKKKKRCWELTWEGLDSCWARVRDGAQWLDYTQLRLDRLLRPWFDLLVQSHTSFGAVRSCRFILFEHTSHKSHRSPSFQYSSTL